MKGYLLLMVVLCGAMLACKLTLLPAKSTPAEPARWRTDLPASLQEASSTGKDVLVVFLAEEQGKAPSLCGSVDEDRQLLEAAAKKFVPVQLVVSTDSERASENAAGIVALAERLNVPRVPSVVLIDSSGQPYATVDCNDPSPTAQSKAVDAAAAERERRDDALKLASTASGADRARHLHQAMQHVGPFAVTAYESTVAEILALDPDDALHLKSKYIEQYAAQRIDRLVQARVYPLIDRANFEAAIAAIDQITASEKPPTLQAQMLAGFKGQLLGSMGKKDAARQTLKLALALAPRSKSADQIARALEHLDE